MSTAVAVLLRAIRECVSAAQAWMRLFGRSWTRRARRTHCREPLGSMVNWANVDVEVSERTISRRTFFANHVASLVSMDFLTVPTLTGRVLFVLVLLTPHRRIVQLTIAEHPTAAWTAQQIVEA